MRAAVLVRVASNGCGEGLSMSALGNMLELYCLSLMPRLVGELREIERSSSLLRASKSGSALECVSMSRVSLLQKAFDIVQHAASTAGPTLKSKRMDERIVHVLWEE